MIISYTNRNHNHIMILFSISPWWADDLSPLSQTKRERLRAGAQDQQICLLGSPRGTHWPCLSSLVLLEFSEGTLYEGPNLLVGIQEPTLIVPYLRRVTERILSLQTFHGHCLEKNLNPKWLFGITLRNEPSIYYSMYALKKKRFRIKYFLILCEWGCFITLI